MLLSKYFTRSKKPVNPSESSPHEEFKEGIARTRKILDFVNWYGYRFPLSNDQRTKLVRDLADLYRATADLLPGERRDKIDAYIERNATSFGEKPLSASSIESFFNTL